MIVFSFSEAPVSGADFIRNPLGSAKMHFLKAVLLILPLPPPTHLPQPHPHSLGRLVGLFYLYCPSVIKVIFAALFLHQTHFTWSSFLLISFIFMNIAATVEFWMNVDPSGSACVWLDGPEVTEEDVCVSSAGGWDVSPSPSTSNTICSVSDGFFSDGLSLSWLDVLTRKRKGWKLRTGVYFIYAKANLPTNRVLSREVIVLTSGHRFKANFTATGRPSHPLPLRC